MSNDLKTSEFVRDCVLRGARFGNAGHLESASMMLYTAKRAIMSPQETAPLHHYSSDVAGAIRHVFGQDHLLADRSHHVQLEAVALWSWYSKTFDSEMEPTMRAAIHVWDNPSAKWRHEIFEIFANHPYRLHQQRERAELEAWA